MDFRTAYGERFRVPFATVGASRTKQSFKDECDINRVLAKAERSGMVSHVNRFQGEYGDFLNSPIDYQSACNQVLAAQAAFGSLPSAVRKRFQNDPGAFLEFVGNPANADEMVTLGLRVKVPPVDGTKVETAEPAAQVPS